MRQLQYKLEDPTEALKRCLYWVGEARRVRTEGKAPCTSSAKLKQLLR